MSFSNKLILLIFVLCVVYTIHLTFDLKSAFYRKVAQFNDINYKAYCYCLDDLSVYKAPFSYRISDLRNVGSKSDLEHSFLINSEVQVIDTLDSGIGVVQFNLGFNVKRLDDSRIVFVPKRCLHRDSLTIK